MSKALSARVAALEAAKESQDLPNGGIVCVAMEDGETQELARARVMDSEWVNALTARQRARLCLILLDKHDQAL